MNEWKETDLIYRDCNFCHSKVQKFLYKRPDSLKVVQCEDCGLVYLNPRPKDELIANLYSSDYFSSVSDVGYLNYFDGADALDMQSTALKRLRLLESNNVELGAKAIEIGCASGDFSRVLHERGVDVTGIDISVAAIEKARSRHSSVQFSVGTMQNIEQESEYNLIVAFEVIEHLTDPNSFFGKASQILAKGGFLCVSTPSYECAEKVGFENWVGFSTSFEHIYFFSGDSLKNYAERHGFTMVRLLYGGGKGVNGIKSQRNPLRKAAKEVLKFTKLLDLANSLRKSIVEEETIDYQTEDVRHNLFLILRKV